MNITIWLASSGINTEVDDHLSFSNNEFNVFPDPVSKNNFNISYSLSERSSVTIKLFDVTGRLIHSINKMDAEKSEAKNQTELSDREKEFLKLACTEMTYKEIAEKMFLSPRTIDGYRDALFEKLQLKTRVGLVMYAIKNGIVNIS